AVALFVIIAAGRLYVLGRQVGGTDLASAAASATFAQSVHVDAAALRKPPKRAPSLMTAEAAACSEPIDAARLTLLATFVAQPEERKPRPVPRFLQAADGAALADRLVQVLTSEALRGPVKLDLLTRRAPLTADGIVA